MSAGKPYRRIVTGPWCSGCGNSLDDPRNLVILLYAGGEVVVAHEGECEEEYQAGRVYEHAQLRVRMRDKLLDAVDWVVDRGEADLQLPLPELGAEAYEVKG